MIIFQVLISHLGQLSDDYVLSGRLHDAMIHKIIISQRSASNNVPRIGLWIGLMPDLDAGDWWSDKNIYPENYDFINLFTYLTVQNIK